MSVISFSTNKFENFIWNTINLTFSVFWGKLFPVLSYCQFKVLNTVVLGVFVQGRYGRPQTGKYP